MKNKIIFLSLLTICFLVGDFCRAESLKSPDAIAIRVLPNPDHFSASTWYKKQGFQGSPQTMQIDGYDAIRDGRSVYVNAANLLNANSKIYTNIYVISYNQSSEDVTTDIFGELLSHWKFNRNIKDTGFCNMNLVSCSTENDCPKDQTCSKGVCALKKETRCLTDIDCPIGIYCTAKKAKITRDVMRMSDIADMGIALDHYYSLRGFYPKLESGTYLPGKSVSVWPSWQNRLGTDLSGFAVDPINKIGKCGTTYNQQTCWDEAKKSFSGSVPIVANINKLPLGSLVYTYSALNSGAKCLLCAVTESGNLTNLYCLNK